MHKTILLITLSLLTIACAPKVKTKISQKYPPLNYQEEVMVVELGDSSMNRAELLGTVKIGDAGMTTNCNYATVIGKAKEEARKSGGNVVKITEHKLPDFMSSCHRITAEILKADAAQLSFFKTADEEIDSTLAYAVLYVYRNGGTGPLVGYNLYLGDSLICRVTNKFKQEIRINNSGVTALWAKTESKVTLPIDLKKGKTYYVRCSVAMGIMVGRPSLELINSKAGSREYLSIKTRSK